MTSTDLVERRANVLARVDTDSWTAVVADVGRLAGMIARTEFVPANYRGNEAAVAAAILYGREVGLPPMTSLREIYVLDGRPSLYAEAMRGLVVAAGHDFEYHESTGSTCTAAGRRAGSQAWHTVTWTIADARQAELIRPKGNWVKYPRAMLKARACAELCRDLFSDVLHGFAAVEEISPEAPLRGTADAATLEAPEEIPPSSTTVQRKTRKAATPKPLGAPVSDRTPEVAPSHPETATGPGAPPPLPGDEGYGTWDPTTSTVGGETPREGSSPPVVEPDAPIEDPPDPPRESPPSVGAPPPVDEVAAEILDADAANGFPDFEPEVVEGEIVVVDDPEPVPATRREIVKILVDFENLGIGDHDRRVAYMAVLVGRDLSTSNDLTHVEAHALIETLALCKTREDLDNVAAATDAHRRSTDA